MRGQYVQECLTAVVITTALVGTMAVPASAARVTPAAPTVSAAPATPRQIVVLDRFVSVDLRTGALVSTDATKALPDGFLAGSSV